MLLVQLNCNNCWYSNILFLYKSSNYTWTEWLLLCTSHCISWIDKDHFDIHLQNIDLIHKCLVAWWQRPWHNMFPWNNIWKRNETDQRGMKNTTDESRNVYITCRLDKSIFRQVWSNTNNISMPLKDKPLWVYRCKNIDSQQPRQETDKQSLSKSFLFPFLFPLRFEIMISIYLTSNNIHIYFTRIILK